MYAVLFVDDSGDLAGRVRPFLEKTGEIRVDPVRSLKQAADLQRSRTYDVILCCESSANVNGIEFVPDMSGTEFVRILRAAGNATPVILISRKPGNRFSLIDAGTASEILLPASGDLRAPAGEILTLIRQSVLRRKAEREIRARNEQLAEILSLTPLGIFQLRDGIIRWVNPRFASQLGYAESELVGKEIASFFAEPDEFRRFSQELRFRPETAESCSAGCDLRRKDRTLFSCQIRTPVPDPRDASLAGTFVVTDISEKKALADALKQSEARYRELLSSTQSIIIRMDLAGTITFCNQYALSFFDYASEDLVGKNVAGTIVSQKTRAGHDLSVMADDLGFNADGYAVNVSENIRRNGDRVWIAWINRAIRDEAGHITEILCIGNDITDHKRDGAVRISTDTWKDLVVSDTDVAENVFDAVFHICTEISIEGREGKPVGTTFLIGDLRNVLEKSRQIILNPFEGHPPASRLITNPGLRENIKALAQLDGAFVITGDGFVESVGRYITVDSSSVTLPPGMGTRHNSVAAITSVTKCVGIVVSQSGGGITVFRNGRIVKKITL